VRLPTTVNAFVEADVQRRKQMAPIARRFRLLAITALVALSLGAFAGGAAAANGPAQVGACNMIHALSVGANGGLFHAWVGENANGWDGKWVGVAASGCAFEKFPQP
jgi:putative copper export protein